jgi:xanthine dehydrogenase YagR molybdenum-binding subunit
VRLRLTLRFAAPRRSARAASTIVGLTFVNHDLAEYHVAVNGDVPDLEVAFLEEHDGKAKPLGAKGLDELGVCGAAVANAVYNATGMRVREFPITLDKLLLGLPVAAL